MKIRIRDWERQTTGDVLAKVNKINGLLSDFDIKAIEISLDKTDFDISDLSGHTLKINKSDRARISSSIFITPVVSNVIEIT